MSATSGISVSDALSSELSSFFSSSSILRFLKIEIQNESLERTLTIPPSSPSATFVSDLSLLHAGNAPLTETDPAYILARMDSGSPSSYLLIVYIPDSASVRAKMLYASTRSALLKALPVTLGPQETLHATTPDDLTAEGWAAHVRHVNAPKPMSEREKEMKEIREREREAEVYAGARGRATGLVLGGGSTDGDSKGLLWPPDMVDAVYKLGANETGVGVVVAQIDIAPNKEQLAVASSSFGLPGFADVQSAVPTERPAYIFLSRRSSSSGSTHIALLYSCPSSAPVKHRMVYSSGIGLLWHQAKTLLTSNTVPPTQTPHSLPSNLSFSPSITLASRRLESSDPSELTESWFEDEWKFLFPPSAAPTPVSFASKSPATPSNNMFRNSSGIGSGTTTKMEVDTPTPLPSAVNSLGSVIGNDLENRMFAKPKGPPRRAR